MLETLQSMDTVTLKFSQDSLLALNITIALIMFGVALGIKTEHFTRLIKKPRPIISGLITAGIWSKIPLKVGVAE